MYWPTYPMNYNFVFVFIYSYDPLRDIWSSAPNMEARRSTLGVAVLNDCIYAVGGFDGSTGLNSAEVLDLSVASPIMVS